MRPVSVGNPAPDFQCTAIVDGRRKQVSLASYTDANHWLILVFFPKAWSFICPTEIRAFSNRIDEFLYERSCAVVFASTDSDTSLRAWVGASESEGGLGGAFVPLISDCNHQLARDYGVLIEEEGVTQRALFMIDPKGTVRGVTINDADIGRSVDETLRILDALVFKDELGEGCPADWKHGDKGIDLTLSPVPEYKPTVNRNRQSWSEWARPKLSRAFSGTSQSVKSGFLSSAASVNGIGPQTPADIPAPLVPSSPSTGYFSISHKASSSVMTSSPLASPAIISAVGQRHDDDDTPVQLEREVHEAILRQRLENMHAHELNGERLKMETVAI